MRPRKHTKKQQALTSDNDDPTSDEEIAQKVPRKRTKKQQALTSDEDALTSDEAIAPQKVPRKCTKEQQALTSKDSLEGAYPNDPCCGLRVCVCVLMK